MNFFGIQNLCSVEIKSLISNKTGNIHPTWLHNMYSMRISLFALIIFLKHLNQVYQQATVRSLDKVCRAQQFLKSLYFGVNFQ